MDSHTLDVLMVVLPAVVGATWVLRSSLSRVDVSTKATGAAIESLGRQFLDHVKTDRQRFARHDARIRKLERTVPGARRK